jgi:type VI secretion system secreted protein VgrG
MGDTTQDDRLLAIFTPLGKDYLLLNKFSVTEQISELFAIEAELLLEEDDATFNPTVIDPASLLGKGVTITVSAHDGSGRDFSGMVSRFTQGNRNTRFSYYNITIVPHVWMLTQKRQSRIFQQKTVKEILEAVFAGFEVKFELQNTYNQRNYCVQYRETDFDFAARLMEEEGIFFFFEHIDGKDRMVIADTPQSHRDCPNKSSVPFFVKVGEQEDFLSAVNTFLSGYNLQTGKVTLWDNNFQLPGKKLDKEEQSRFTFGDNKKLELYDFPGGYARKYDGIDKGGSEQSGELTHIFDDREATVRNVIEALDARATNANGKSDCGSFIAGGRFTLTDHPNADLNGQYILTEVEHSAEQNPAYVSNEQVTDPYTNKFSCVGYGAGKPAYRPLRTLEKPIIHGSQTAFVVGPAGEEIFTDKYGRIKVQFNWDRDGKDDASSSCWVRVAQTWAGNKWGGMFIPRIGMEVLVHFLEGDPDQPIVTGCVYNPQTMPPYTLPDEKTKSTMKSNSTTGGGGFNEFRFEDKKGSEQIFMHGQKDLDIRIRNNRRELIGNDRHLIVKRDKREKVERDEHIIIERDLKENIKRDYSRKVEGKVCFETTDSFSNKVGGSMAEQIGGSFAQDTAQSVYIKAGMKVIIEAGAQLTIKGPGGFVDIGPSGVTIEGTMVLINSGGAAGVGTPGSIVPPEAPDEAEIADNADPGSDAPTYKNQRRETPPALVPSYTQPSHNPNTPPNKKKKSWIELELLDQDGNPVVGERYRVTLPDGKTLAEGTTNDKGFARVSNIDPGNCKITFPKLDKSAWKKK